MGKPVGGALGAACGRSLWENLWGESVGEPVSTHTLGQTLTCLSKPTDCWRLVLHFPSFFLTTCTCCFASAPAVPQVTWLVSPSSAIKGFSLFGIRAAHCLVATTLYFKKNKLWLYSSLGCYNFLLFLFCFVIFSFCCGTGIWLPGLTSNSLNNLT